MINWVEPGCSLPDGADGLPVDGDSEGLRAVRVEGGAAAALAGERPVEPHHLVSRLVCHSHVETPHIPAPEPLAPAGVLLGPVEDLLLLAGDGEPVLLLTPGQHLARLDLLLDHELPAGLERPKPGEDRFRLTLQHSTEMDLLGPEPGLLSDGRHFLDGSREQVVVSVLLCRVTWQQIYLDTQSAVNIPTLYI